MKPTRIFLLVLMISAVAFLYSGCKKNTETKQNNTKAASENALAEKAFDDVKDWSDKAMAGAKLKSGSFDTIYMGTCVVATLDYSTIPFVLTIDFGTTNCQCDDGVYRRGKIIVTFSGDYWAQGTVITYGFENYFFNDNQVLGTKTVTNKGRNQAQNLYWEVVVDGQIIKANNGGTLTWNSSYQYEWSAGEPTPGIWWDDVYKLTGTASGISTDGESYTYTITSPLVKKLSCEWIVSGTIEMQIQGYPLITVDYGTGNCDAVATALVNGVTYTITLP
jgi:hypothetical protein